MTEVEPNTPAAAAGLKVGDRIVALDGALLINGDFLMNELAKRTSDDEVSLRLVRDGALITSDVSLRSNAANAIAGANGQPTKAAAAKPTGAGAGLQGIGSMLGGLLGGAKANKPANKKPEKVVEDEMAFGDDEPIRQVGFEEKAEVVNPLDQPTPAKDADGLSDDPPSLDAIELPTGQAAPIELIPPTRPTTSELAEQLRSEIRRLQQQLQELEAKPAEKAAKKKE